MISTHTSLPPVTSLRPVGQAPTTTPAVSAAARVIGFFHSRHNSQHTDAPAWQRIEYLLRQTQTKDQPSLAEQIDQRVKNSADPLTDPILRNEAAQLLNQPSALNSQKTYAELVQDILDNPLPRTRCPHDHAGTCRTQVLLQTRARPRLADSPMRWLTMRTGSWRLMSATH
ncbi:hypothetical protein [Pseudomonas sp. 2822-17]|uniref:hypothetical protein n=1 Tax=Pseudomonas sp. 2822-17 TaxID=1712678 RepID=UPI0015A94882|nr:hypothetical protein [Pseudomonas sp. 2822-17]